MIVNATPLIIFGKINKLELLQSVFKNLVISPEVYDEVVIKGMEIDAPDAYLVKEYVDTGKIKVKSLDQKSKKIFLKIKRMYGQLDEGEASTIALALQEHASEVLMDEDIGRKIARLHNIKPRGSLRVLILGYQKGLLNEKQVNETLNLMMQANFRVGAEVITRFWTLLEQIK